MEHVHASTKIGFHYTVSILVHELRKCVQVFFDFRYI